MVRRKYHLVSNGVLTNGYHAYDQNNIAKRPAVLVVHQWWGLTDYPKFRALELAVKF
jgi:dienelactone hydrolase